MPPQIKLEISTGNGNTVVAANCGILNPIYQPLLDIALEKLSIAEIHGQSADKIGSNYLDRAVESLRNNRSAYQELTEAQIDLRPQVLDFVLKWRDSCRAHPLATIYIVP